MRVLAVLLLAACGGSGVELPIDGGPDAQPASASVERCRTVGAGFCDGAARCRPETHVGCEDRWFYYHCRAPEPLNDAEADACAEAFRATTCEAWWGNGWWESTAPSCAELTQP